MHLHLVCLCPDGVIIGWKNISLQFKSTRFSDNTILCILKIDGLIWNRSFNNRHYNTVVSRLSNRVLRSYQLPPTQFQTAARAVSNCGPSSFKLRPAQFQTAARAVSNCGPRSFKLRPAQFQTAARVLYNCVEGAVRAVSNWTGGGRAVDGRCTAAQLPRTSGPAYMRSRQ